MANTKTILGFIAGASLGAIAGILIAPDSGKATRGKIRDKAGTLSDAVKDAVTGYTGKLQKKTEKAVLHPDVQAGEEKIRSVMHNAKESIA